MTTLGPPNTEGLRAAEERAASHGFAFSSDLIGSASPDGYFTALNPAWEKTLGFSVESLMEQPFLAFVHPADREATTAEMTRLGAERVGPEVFENRYAVKSGGWCWLSWQVEVSDEAYYFIARDVTARVAADQRGHLLANIVEGWTTRSSPRPPTALSHRGTGRVRICMASPRPRRSDSRWSI